MLRVLLALSIGLLGLATWLLLPRGARAAEREPGTRVVLVDASASVRRRRPAWISWARGALREEARAAEAAGEPLAVVSFAAEVERRFGPQDPARFLEELAGIGGAPFDPRPGTGSAGGDPRPGMGGDGASDLARALRVGRELARADARSLSGTVVVLGDARPVPADGGDPLAEVEAQLRLLRAGGIGWRWRPPPPPELPDLALLALELPARAEEGAPLAAVASLWLGPGRAAPQGATLVLDLENGSERWRVVHPLDLPPPGTMGSGEPGGAAGERWRVAVALGPARPGRTGIVARVRLAPTPDPVPENDVASAACVAHGARVVGVVAQDLEAARRWLIPAGVPGLVGLHYLFVEPAALAGVLADLDALVTFDVAPALLPAGPLEAWVARGGGWLALSGWGLLRDWSPGADESALHRLLPLRPAPLEQAPRDVTLLVDGSGSMDGEPFETVRRASLGLAAAALPDDRVELRFFTATLEPPHRIKERGAERGQQAALGAARALLEARVPGGSTFLLHSIEEYARERAASPGSEGLALLLTDGREQDAIPDPAARAAGLHAALRATRTRLVVVAVGESVDEDFLALLAPPGQGFERVEDLDDLEGIFRREISGAQWREGRDAPIPVRPVDPGGIEPGGLAAQVLPGGAEPEPPPLARVVRDALRPGAEALYETDAGEPVLAVQRAGLGRTAVFASAPLADWAPDWIAGPGLGEPRLFAPLLRWLARGTPRDPGPAAHVEGGELVVEGLAGAPLLLAARVVATEQGEEELLGELELAPPMGVEPGPPGRRRARLPAELRARLAAPGRWLVLAETGEAERWLPLPVLVPAELAPEGPRLDPRLLAGEPAGEGGEAGVARAGGPPGILALGAGLALLFAVSLARVTGSAPAPGAPGRQAPGRLGR